MNKKEENEYPQVRTFDAWAKKRKAEIEDLERTCVKMKALSTLTGSDLGLDETEVWFMDNYSTPERVRDLLEGKWLRDLDVKGLMRMN